MRNETYFKANLLWNFIVTYKGARKFYEETLKDVPIEGIDENNVYSINAVSIADDMCFAITFKDDRHWTLLNFHQASTLHRIEKFMDKHLKSITWE